MSIINGHTCIGDDGGTPNRRCYACENELNEKMGVPIRYVEQIFELTLDEARALNSLLRLHHSLFREMPEYIHLLRLINGLGTFVDQHDK